MMLEIKVDKTREPIVKIIDLTIPKIKISSTTNTIIIYFTYGVER